MAFNERAGTFGVDHHNNSLKVLEDAIKYSEDLVGLVKISETLKNNIQYSNSQQNQSHKTSKKSKNTKSDPENTSRRLHTNTDLEIKSIPLTS